MASIQNHKRRSYSSNRWVLSLLVKTVSTIDRSRMDVGSLGLVVNNNKNYY